MSEFIISYRKPKRSKIWTKKAKADNGNDAIKQFLENAKQVNIIGIEEVEISSNTESKNVSSLASRRMKISNSFEQFIFHAMEKNNLTNQNIYEFLHIDKKAWIKNRKHPENFYIYDVMLLSQLFKLPFNVVLITVKKAIKENQENNILAPVRFKNKKPKTQ